MSRNPWVNMHKHALTVALPGYQKWTLNDNAYDWSPKSIQSETIYTLSIHGCKGWLNNLDSRKRELHHHEIKQAPTKCFAVQGWPNDPNSKIPITKVTRGLFRYNPSLGLSGSHNKTDSHCPERRKKKEEGDLQGILSNKKSISPVHSQHTQKLIFLPLFIFFFLIPS